MRRADDVKRRRARWSVAGLCMLTALAHATPPVLADFAAILPQLQPPLRAQLHQRAAQWAGWSAGQREQFAARAATWDGLPRDVQVAKREQYVAWQALPPREREQVRAAASGFAALPPAEQQALRARFDALDGSERRGWLLGPVLGADYVALQPLLAQLPLSEHAPMLQVLRAMTAQQRANLAVLVQRTPPSERAALRRELLSTAASNREDWLWLRLDR